MCGIAGYVGHRRAVPIILEGLASLEYRGYDSAGLSVVDETGLRVHKVMGRVADLVDSMPEMGTSSVGIGHTRWATHGRPSAVNAHPHLDSSCRFSLVHNGIIENAAMLRSELEAAGVEFASSTDTEVLVHLMAAAGTDDLEAAIRFALTRAEGTYAIAAIGKESPDQIVVARSGSPVVIGIGDGEHFVASDIAAFARYTQRVVYLEDHELAVLTPGGFSTRGLDYVAHAATVKTVSWERSNYETGEFSHFMQKEIHEQPVAIRRLADRGLNRALSSVNIDELEITARDAQAIRRVILLGCGSAYYAGLAGALLIERITGIPADAVAASEFRYRGSRVDPDTLYVALSQSGETLDTLQAVLEVQRQGGQVVGVVNVPDSSIARACGRCLYLGAGPEISVTSTKTFTSTFVALALVALGLAERRSALSEDDLDRLIGGIDALPGQLEMVIEREVQVAQIAARYAHVQSAFFVGRVAGLPVALEGSQKLKEVSYIHAEAYPCGELKHGPLALISAELPTVAIVPDDVLFSKNMGTLEEIRARSGPIIAVGHSDDLKSVADEVVIVPRSEPELESALLVVPLQMLAYHSAVALGLDVDKPRNLAKSVTVE